MTADVLAGHRSRFLSRRLRYGRLRHTAQGYSIIERASAPDCVYCPGCGVALAEVARGNGRRWVLCTRRGEPVAQLSRESALVRAVDELAQEGWECECMPT